MTDDTALATALGALVATLQESAEEAQQLTDNGGTIAHLVETLAHALVEVDVVAVLCGEATTMVTQLQTALDTRIIIEQAKGVVAERANITVAEAWARIRNYARNHNRRAGAVAVEIVEDTLMFNDRASLMERLP